MVQVPVPMNVAVEPETVQTAGVVDAKLTASPELAVADRTRVVPAVCGAIPAKAMVSLARAGVWLCGVDPPHPPKSKAQESAPRRQRKRVRVHLVDESIRIRMAAFKNVPLFSERRPDKPGSHRTGSMRGRLPGGGINIRFRRRPVWRTRTKIGILVAANYA